jgi:serine/threonine protein kinase
VPTTDDALQPPIPKTIGRFVIERHVASGGMGDVYRAHPMPEIAHEIAHPVVAIKTLLASVARNRQYRQMFEDEARVSWQIQHPNVVRVLDFGDTDDGTMYMVMEWLDGIDLATVAQSFRDRKLRLHPAIASAILVDALLGLHAAHTRLDAAGRLRCVVHRDVSPHNVIVTSDGRVKIVDFGLSRPVDRPPRTTPGYVKGKFAYLTPEQSSGHAVDVRSDIFAAGIVLWEALAGRYLFRQDRDADTLQAIKACKVRDIRHYAPGLDDRVAHAIGRALQRAPDERFQTAQDFARALGGYVDEALPSVRERADAIQSVVKNVRLAMADAAGEQLLDAADLSMALIEIDPSS